MKAIYVQKGEALYVTPEENVTNGSVVSLGTRIGIAAGDIPAGGTGTVRVEGVFKLAKAEGEAVALGAAVYYNKAADAVSAAAEGNIPAGYAVQAAAENDAAVLVKLLG